MNPFSDSALFLRSRSVWEAADSGILLWRNSFKYFFPFFALPVLLVACALRFLLDADLFLLSYFIIWWLKPLFDRLVLHVVSARFFRTGEDSPSLHKGLTAMRRGLVGDLLWRRFSPNRAAHMPIRVLERTGGRLFHKRKTTLAEGGLKFCTLISFMGLALEAFLLLSKVLFTVIITRMFFPHGIGLMANNMELVELLIFAAFCFNYILVGSLYVCMGFGLYVNSRVEVEGWDLQLLFQQFAARPSAHRPGIKTLILLCLFLTLPRAAYTAPDAYLDQGPPPEPAAEETLSSSVDGLPYPDAVSLEILESILASPDFGGFRESRGIRFRERERRERPERREWDFSALAVLRGIFGYLLRAAVIIAFAAFLVFAVYWYWKNHWKGIPRFGDRDKGKNYINPLFSPESPQSLFSGAEDFFRRGNLREAWAACLAGCIGACSKYRSLSFPADATENGCLDLVRRSLPDEAAGFGSLVRNWILLAYGGKPPGEGAFEDALAWGRSLLPVPEQRRPDEA